MTIIFIYINFFSKEIKKRLSDVYEWTYMYSLVSLLSIIFLRYFSKTIISLSCSSWLKDLQWSTEITTKNPSTWFSILLYDELFLSSWLQIIASLIIKLFFFFNITVLKLFLINLLRNMFNLVVENNYIELHITKWGSNNA